MTNAWMLQHPSTKTPYEQRLSMRLRWQVKHHCCHPELQSTFDIFIYVPTKEAVHAEVKAQIRYLTVTVQLV